MGKCRAMTVPILTRRVWVAPDALQEWIDDLDAVDNAPVLHIFREQNAAAGFFGTVKYERIPIGKPVQSMEVDCRKNIRGDWFIEMRIGINLLPS